jgi:hypothetical protein
MITPQALEIVLSMARKCRHAPDAQELEAIEEVEFLLSSFDDEGYDEDEYC